MGDIVDFADDYRRNGSTRELYLKNFLVRFAERIETRIDKLEFRIKRLEKEK